MEKEEIDNSDKDVNIAEEENMQKLNQDDTLAGKESDEEIVLSRNEVKVKELEEENKEDSKLLGFLKFFSLFFLLISIPSSFFLSIFLNKDNLYLSVLNKQNLYQEYKKINTENTKLSKEIKGVRAKKNMISDKINRRDFSENKEVIDLIDSSKIYWLHSYNQETNSFNYGLYDTIFTIRDFFNHPENFSTNFLPLENKILFGKNGIEISNFSGDEKEIRFSVKVSQGLDKVFFLAAKLAESINEFPIYKDVEIKNFSRENLSTGETSMTFVMTVKLQKENEEDLLDKGSTYQIINSYLTKNRTRS